LWVSFVHIRKLSLPLDLVHFIHFEG
jgi:hypothetical protein